MLHEHEVGRQCVASMRRAGAERNSGDFAAAATAYHNLLRQHILKENHVLFVMAEGCLSAADDREIAAGYAAADAARRGRPGAQELAAELEAWSAAG